MGLKINYLAGVLITLAILDSSKAQDFSHPIVINDIIGDTLDREERDDYRLFESVAGFNWALFSIGGDSTVYAMINADWGGVPSAKIFPYCKYEDFRKQIKAAHNDLRPYWANCGYISCGYSNPLGTRIELGATSNFLSLAITGYIEDSWSGDKVIPGVRARINFPYKYLPISPYLSFGAGQTLNLFDISHNDSFWECNFGMRIIAAGHFQVCPEIGAAGTAKYISHSNRHPVESSKYHRIYVAYSISIEYDL